MRGLHTAQVAVRSCRHTSIAVASRGAVSCSKAAAFRPTSPALLLTRSYPSHVAHRSFSQTSLLAAKKHREKVKKAAAREADESDDEVGEEGLPSESRRKSRDRHAPPSDFDHESAFDFKDVEEEYKKIDARFTERLRTFKAGGGRFNPDQLGNLRIQPDKKDQATYPLRELATVVQKGGRTVSILASDVSYVKPIMSAVLKSSEFNQQPQRDEDNELELLLRIEAENPEELAKRLKAECNSWRDAIREVFSTRKSKHAAWGKAKHVTKDDVKTLDNKVKALQDKKMDEITKAEKQAQTELANRQQRL